MSENIESIVIVVSVLVALIITLIVYLIYRGKWQQNESIKMEPLPAPEPTPIPVVNTKLNPIIVIPGLGGTNLEYKLDESFKSPVCDVQKLSELNSSLWINPLGLLFQKDCFLELLKPIYNRGTPDGCEKTLKNYPGLTVFPKAKYLGDPLSSICLSYLFNSTSICFPETDYSKNFVNFFTNKGYKSGYNLFIPGYDFRLVPYTNEYFDSLKVLIESVVETTGKKVFLMGHSLGTLLGNMFLNKMCLKWKDKHIKSFVAISPSYDGGPKSLRTALSGFNFGLPNFIRTTNFEFAYPERSMAGLAITIPLLPKMYGPTNCDNEGNGEAVTLLNSAGDKKVYNVNDYKDGIITVIRKIAKKTNTPDLETFADIVSDLSKKKKKYAYTDPNVKVYQIIVQNVPTESSYIYALPEDGSTGSSLNISTSKSSLNSDPVFTGTVSGDEDIPIYGGKIPQLFGWKNFTNKFFLPLNGLDHFTAYSDSELVYTYIYEQIILNGST